MKEYIIPIEDIIVKPELFYAHCDRGNGKNPEILKEHVDRCYHYFEELWEHKNFKAVFENFQKELSPELSDEGIKLFYSLIVNVIKTLSASNYLMDFDYRKDNREEYEQLTKIIK
mgnify:CR=1 FL=1